LASISLYRAFGHLNSSLGLDGFESIIQDTVFHREVDHL
jgi:hypothetical protein